MKLRDLERLKPLQQWLSFLPTRGKRPLQDDWPNQPGLTVEELINYPGSNSVGVRTGPQHGPLAIFDIDGETGLELGCAHGMEPWSWDTWQIHRREAPFRLKLLCNPTPEQLQQLERPSFSKSVNTKPPIKDDHGNVIQKREGLEFFFGGKQGIVWGQHPEGGCYHWPDGLGPEALSAPPEQWWQFAVEQSRSVLSPRGSTGIQRYPRGNRGRRLDPCPICSRRSGTGSELWCEEKGELLFCMNGSTFSAEMSHPSLKVGDVIDGWAAVKNNSDGDWTFRKHRPSPLSQLRKNREMPHLTADLPTGWQGDKRTPLGPGDLALLFREAPYELSFNELGLQVLMDGVPLKSDDIDLAYVGLSEQGYKAKKGEASDALLKVAFERRFHPVRRYLESLRGRTHLPEIDIHTLAQKYLGLTAADALDANPKLRTQLLGGVHRALNPGCKFDTCLVFHGDQEGGKFTFFKSLASPTWFYDTQYIQRKLDR